MTATSSATTTGLDVFRDPSSVAVVGASDDSTKWGYWLASGALAGAHRRRVHFVNRRAGSVLGQPCAPSLSDLPEVPELVALSVPATHVPAVVDEALELGVRGFLGITTGIPDEHAVAERIRAHGARLLGANSLGIFDADTELRLAWGHFTAGSLAIVSQSGQLGSELAVLGANRGLGISRFLSIGNQSDAQAAELLGELADHSATEVVALYLESFTNGRVLFEALQALRAAGKPTLLLTVGASSASARLARSHTGALTSTMDVVDAACRAAGVYRVSTPSALIDTARAFSATSIPRGNRVAIVGDSGGQCGIAADVASAVGLTVPALGGPVAHWLDTTLPEGASRTNPVDLAGIGEQDLTNYASISEHLLDSDEVDAVVLTGYFGCYGADTACLHEDELAVARQLGEASRNSGTPLIVHTMAPDSDTSQVLWDSGVPAFGRVEDAVGVVAALGGLRVPSSVRSAPERTQSAGALRAGYWAARDLLAGAGVQFPRAQIVRGVDDLVHAGTQLSAPYVLKAGWLEHKTEVGGVVVGIADLAALATTFEDMRARLGDGDYVLEELDARPAGVEILVGARRDPDFGPVVVVGAGGAEAEVHRDTALELAPVSASSARAMLERLRCAALLHGWRGKPSVDIEGLAAVVSTVSEVIEHHSDIAEIELNPVRVTPDGALAVDALVTTEH